MGIGEVVECFDETLETKNYERCIGESSSTSTEEKMVDGVMCVLKSWKYGMEYVKNATMGGKPKRRPGHGRGKGKKGKMGMKEKMLTIAHCANANKGDEARQGECKKCFMEEVMGCYIRVLVSDLVQPCSNGVNEVTAETMN